MLQRRKIYKVEPRSIREISQSAARLLFAAFPDLLSTPGPFPAWPFFEQKMPEILGFTYDVADLDRPKLAETDLVNRVVTLDSCIYDDLCNGDGRARFTLCHELGHVCLHTELRTILINGGRVTTLNRGDIPLFRDSEWQADTFAAALLMPEHHVRKMMQRDADEEDLVNTFGVSYQSARIRLEKLSK